MMARARVLTCALLLAGGTATAVSTFAWPQSPTIPPTTPYDVTQMTLKLDIDIPQKLSLGKWTEADKTCTEIINRSREQVETPEVRAILIRAYEARGRARLNIKDMFEAAHEDFYNLLNIAPDHKLTPPVADAELAEYQKVQAAALGRVALSMDPVGTARLERIDGVSGEHLFQALKRRGHLDVRLVPSRDQIAETLLGVVRPGDLVLTLGAGDIWKAGDLLAARFAASRAGDRVKMSRGRA